MSAGYTFEGACSLSKKGGDTMKTKKRVGTVGKALGCIVLLLISLFPIYWLLAMSIRPTDEMKGHISLIPQSLTGEHFAQLFNAEDFGRAIINSAQTTFGSLIISLVVGICAAEDRQSVGSGKYVG